MKKNRIILLALVLTMAAGLLLGGCAAPGRTSAEVHRDHMNTWQHDLWQMQDDVDAVLMIDRPSRLSDKFVR